MKVFVFGYDRYDCTTSVMLEREGIDHVLLCHLAAGFVEAEVVNPARLVPTFNPKGLAYQRNYALDMMQDGEWALFLVDDMKGVTALRNYRTARSPLPITVENQHLYRARFQKPVELGGFMGMCRAYIPLLERNGAKLGGWCGVDNPLYRAKHYTTNVLLDGRAWLVQKSHLRFDENVQLIDDVCWTALNIREFGIVVCDQWILPDCERYTRGGFGGLDERMEQKRREAEYLVATYPEQVAFKAKAGWPTGTHVVIRQGKKPTVRI